VYRVARDCATFRGRSGNVKRMPGVARDSIAELYGLDDISDDAERRDYLERLLDHNTYTMPRADRELPREVCGGSLTWRGY
jgi:hypothetical protein